MPTALSEQAFGGGELTKTAATKPKNAKGPGGQRRSVTETGNSD
jgi:hypothetical protein